MQRTAKDTNVLQDLSRIGWLSRQPADFQARMASIGRWINVSRGEPIYGTGDEPNGVFGLGEGLLDVSIPISSEEEVTVHRATAGFWIGESALLSGFNRSISISAASDCRLFKLPVSAVLRNLAENPQDWICFQRLSHLNASLCIQILAEVLALPPRVRFARMLLRMASENGDVVATQEELGRMAGMSRSAFRRAFASFIQAGIVETGYGGLKICDPAALQKVADDIEF